MIQKKDYIKITDIEIEDIDENDAPDYCDAYLSYATIEGRELTDAELLEMTEEGSWFYDALLDYLY